MTAAPLATLILAAGKGRRMGTHLPKVMHCLAGIPLLQHVINTAQCLNNNSIHVIYNDQSAVRESFAQLTQVNWVNQEQPLGTGHAVQQALPFCQENARVLILYADVPLIQAATLQRLLTETPHDGLGILVAEVPDPSGLGRIIRDAQGRIDHIVEDKDATQTQRRIQEINTGIMVCSRRYLDKWLSLLTANNHQGEYYLTDIVALAVKQGVAVNSVSVASIAEIQGVNNLDQLAKLERHYQQENAKQLALSGVRIMDANRFDVRGGQAQIASDVIIDINVVIEGKVIIASGAHIGAHCILKDCEIGADVTVLPYTLIEGAKIASGSQVGPFARIRPGTVLANDVKVGNFVEVKNTYLGAESKVSHLSYLGDAKLGSAVNIGAGTITCNYDGANKWQTVIEDRAFVGSNTALVAPIRVGKSATIAAGSTITQDAPDDALTVSRSRQKSFSAWQRPRRNPPDN